MKTANDHFTLRLTLHKGLSLLAAILTAFYIPINFIYLDYPLIGSIELVICAFSLYSFYNAYKSRDLRWTQYTLVFLVTVLVYASSYTTDPRAISVFWWLTLPLIYYIMFGSRQGLIFSLIIVFPGLYILYIKTDPVLALPYRAMVNYTLTHFFIWSLCHLFELQRSRDEIQLYKMAMSDALTGVKNRHALEIDFLDFDTHPDRIHMLLIDIDHFKKINDQFGHSVGDQVLIEAAERLSMYVEDGHIYRLGGEEFVILFYNQSDSEVNYKAESIRHAIEETIFHSHDLRLKITISVGVTRFLPGQALNDFLICADKKLYQAKFDGRNTICS